MKKYYVYVFYLVLSLTSMMSLTAQESMEWTLVEQVKNVKIESAHAVCKSNQGFDYDYNVLKFSNLSSNDITVSYSMTLDYGNKIDANTENTDLKYYTLTIPANSSIEGSCNEFYKRGLCIFDHSITKHQNAFRGQLNSFSIKVIKIK